MSARVLLAAVILVASLGGAVWFWQYEQSRTIGGATTPGPTLQMTIQREPEWADPAAVTLAVVGVGVAGAILVPLVTRRP